MIGPVLWLRSIRERFEFRYAGISLHKTWRRSKRTLDRQKIMPSSSLCSHALVLDAQGFGAFGNTKANRHKIKNEPGGNDRSPQVNDYVKKLGQCHILIRGLTRRISLRTSESALPKTVYPNETVPVNTGHCPRPLPFPQGMTVE